MICLFISNFAIVLLYDTYDLDVKKKVGQETMAIGYNSDREINLLPNDIYCVINIMAVQKKVISLLIGICAVLLTLRVIM